MAFLRRLFGRGSPPQEAIAPVQSRPAEPRSAVLLKAATQLKEEKRYDEAIAALHQAFDEIAKEGGGHPIATYLRLPMMLQLAGRRDEAWREYNGLLAFDPTGMGSDPEIVPMDRSQVYDKMRLMLQREGRNRAAVRMGIFAHVSWALGLKRQRREDELLDQIDADRVSEVIAPMLRRAHAMSAYDDLVALLTTELSHPERIDLAALGKRIDAILSLDQSE